MTRPSVARKPASERPSPRTDELPRFGTGETFARGLRGPEGPVPLEDGSVLVVEMYRNSVTLVSPKGRRSTIATVGRPNGLLRDRSGDLWVAASHPHPALVRLAPDGRKLDEIDLIDGHRLLFPNDLVELPDGDLLITDSGISVDDWAPGGRLRADFRVAPIDGRVYRYDPRRRRGWRLSAGIAFANGIGVTPGGVLIAETLTGRILRLAPDNGWRRETFAQIPLRGYGPLEGPDGLAVAPDGRIIVAVYGHAALAVVRADGTVDSWIPTLGGHPTNVALDGPRLLVTETDRGGLERHHTPSWSVVDTADPA